MFELFEPGGLDVKGVHRFGQIDTDHDIFPYRFDLFFGSSERRTQQGNNEQAKVNRAERHFYEHRSKRCIKHGCDLYYPDEV
jgi:hypothetical protein